jgi:hypothetical protein
MHAQKADWVDPQSAFVLGQRVYPVTYIWAKTLCRLDKYLE